jgi:hypothetical protein
MRLADLPRPTPADLAAAALLDSWLRCPECGSEAAWEGALEGGDEDPLVALLICSACLRFRTHHAQGLLALPDDHGAWRLCR